MPTAPISTARFADYVARNIRDHGMKLRFSFVPYPVVGMPRTALREYVEGQDPVSGRPLMLQIVDAITKPLTDEERHPVVTKQPREPRLLPSDTEENLLRLFVENGWTDGLPIVLPTEERVAEMLAGTSHEPSEVVGRMSITTYMEKLEYTVEKVAVNAVMAGARPEHLPVILAIASTQECSMPSSTGSFARMLVVNGPIRSEIGMNSGLAALSPFNLANAVIGRAWTLMTINFGGAKLGETFMASTGHNANYNNMCCAENEEGSVWEPFHVQKGFKPNQSVVSLFSGFSLLNGFAGTDATRPAVEDMAIMIQAFSGYMFHGATLVIDPLVAKSLRNHGFHTKQHVQHWLSKNVRIPAGKYWGSGVQRSALAPLLRAGIEPYTSWSKLPPEELIAPYSDPEEINILVVGGETNAFFFTMDYRHIRSVSVDDWRAEGSRQVQLLRMPSSVTCSDETCGLRDKKVRAVTDADVREIST